MSQVTGKPCEGQQTSSHVQMTEGSNNDLEDLFRKALDPNRKQQSSFEGRNLPPSFFIQPDPGRQQAVPINHKRSRSSPAQFTPQPFSAAPPHHIRQNSADLLAEDNRTAQAQWKDISKGLPNNLGQNLFINPSVEQPPGNWPGGGGPATQQPQTGTLSPAQPQDLSPAVSVQNLGPLPHGWEQGVTPDGEIYFINHVDRTTSWFDPRIPKNMQRPGPTKLAQTLASGQSNAQLPAQQPPAQQPPQQQQQQRQQTPQPPTPLQGQAQAIQQMSPGQPQSTAATQQKPPLPLNSQGRLSLPNNQFLTIQSELLKLQQEKDRLRKVQDDIAKKELLLKDLMAPMPATGAPSQASGGLQLSLSTSGVDPFLGQASNTSHARQNSGDSGLGGMGAGYSLPRTPDDFLMANVDEMDTQDTASKVPKSESSDFNMNDLQASSVSMEMGNLDMNDPPSGMDSDDLVPSLQEDISSLSSELLQDVDVQKMENLLWL